MSTAVAAPAVLTRRTAGSAAGDGVGSVAAAALAEEIRTAGAAALLAHVLAKATPRLVSR